MKVFDRYFDRNPVAYFPQFTNSPEAIVIIPVWNDRDIFATLDSLGQCTCNAGNAGVIILVNHSEACEEEDKASNRLLAHEIQEYLRREQFRKPGIEFRLIRAFDLPVRYAGVGLARKIAMDEAAFFFYKQGKTACPILSLDADTLVEACYIDEVIHIFRTTSLAGVSIAYAHRWEDMGEEIKDAIIKYELYLRYYQLALRYTGHPHAFPCIGSAFAVRASDYVAQGGMNKRQAGEDFYFLQKLITTGRYALLNTTCVYPSARFSERTPFGTGRSLRQIVENNGVFPVYSFEAFRILKAFFSGIHLLYKAGPKTIEDYFSRQDKSLQAYLVSLGAEAMIAEVNANCASLHQFRRRCFEHFNALRVLQFLNFIHESCLQRQEITAVVRELFQELGFTPGSCVASDLFFLRKLG